MTRQDTLGASVQASLLEAPQAHAPRPGSAQAIVVIGLSHRTAPLALRERFAMSVEQLQGLLGLSASPASPLPEELVVLSTCNRFELYMALDQATAAQEAARRLLSLGEEEWACLLPHLYCHQDEEAVRHLFRVACGLDSLVLGEPQIQGQVADAYRMAEEAGRAGPLLSRLFQEAIVVGKRARTETPIGARPASLGSAAAHAVQHLYPDLKQRRVLVVGAGTMGRLAARYFHDLGVRKLVIVNRTWERAYSLAQEVQAQVWGWETLQERLAWADVAVVATSAPSWVVRAEHIAEAMSHRPERPLTLVDLGVPRNIAPAAAHWPGVRLLDVDALREAVEEGLSARQQTVPQVEALIERSMSTFLQWHRARAVAPTVADLYASAEDLRQREVARALKRLAHLDESDREVLEVVTRSIVDKLLQTPVRRLREMAVEGDSSLYQQMLQELFDLPRGRHCAHLREGEEAEPASVSKNLERARP